MIEILEDIYSFLKYPFPICLGLAFIGIILLLLSNILESIKKNSKKNMIIRRIFSRSDEIFYDEQILMGENIKNLLIFDDDH